MKHSKYRRNSPHTYESSSAVLSCDYHVDISFDNEHTGDPLMQQRFRIPY